MEPVTQAEMMQTCALQAVIIQKLQGQVQRMMAVMEASNQQLVELGKENEQLRSDLEVVKTAWEATQASPACRNKTLPVCNEG